MIKEFKKLITRDLNRDKRLAYKELAFVYLFVDYRSPFCNETSDRKEELIKKELNLDPSWKADKFVNEAIIRYELLNDTPIIRLLKTAKETIEKMETYFKAVDFTERNEKTNALIFTPKEVMSAISEIGDAHSGLKKLEEQIKREMSTSSKIRGGGNAGLFER